MAKTPSQWYDDIVAEKNNFTQLQALQPNIDDAQTLLSDCNSPSKVAQWRLWIWVCAVGAWIQEVMLEKYLALTITAASRQYGTLSWYPKIALEFQIGDPLVWLTDEQRYGYAIIDPAKQIVKKVAVLETNGQVRIKVANYVSNVITPLTPVELAAFDSYINDLRPAGINTAVISRNPDLLKLSLKVTYDPLLLKATGESLTTPGTYPVEDAIVNYLTQLDFGGVMLVNSLLDALQQVAGVVDPVLLSAEAKYGLLPYTAFTESYLSDAGYMIIDPLFPLNTSITYLPNV